MKGVLRGKVAVVTGGSRGIGRAVVLRLSRDGAAVLFTYLRSEARAGEVVAAVTAAGGRAKALAADQGRRADVVRMFDAADAAFGGVDILVNNAGAVRVAAIADVSEEEYDGLMALNARGPFFAMQQAARRLRDGGRIINISTLNTAMAEPGVAVYAAGKAALEQFTRVAALELAGRGITVNAVSPGPTDTNLLRGCNSQEVLRQAVAMTPLGRLGQPEDIADVVAFLAGPDGRWLTGQNLRASGGL